MNPDNGNVSLTRRVSSRESEVCGKIDSRKRGLSARNFQTASSSDATMDLREPLNFQKLQCSRSEGLTNKRRHPSFTRDGNKSTEYFDGDKSVRSYSSHQTASTIGTSDTLSSSLTIGSSKSIRSDASRKKKEVTWEDMLGKGPSTRRDAQSTAMHVQFEKISLEETPVKAARQLKEIEKEFQKLELNIQEACKLELSYLNQANEVRMKRDRWTKQLKNLLENRRDSDDQRKTTMHIEGKIEKARHAESLYLKKSKELHDKRYRWTRQYEYTIREWDKAGGEARVNILLKLPPVRPPTAVGSGSRRAVASSRGE